LSKTDICKMDIDQKKTITTRSSVDLLHEKDTDGSDIHDGAMTEDENNAGEHEEDHDEFAV